MNFAITSRTKTRTTLLEKLRRQPSIKLPAIRDIAGIRIVADVGLLGQDQIAEVIFNLGILVNQKLIDRRIEPMQGYRALHVTGVVDSMSVEIQIRTTLQAAWANLYERLGDRWGRSIRYGDSDDEAVLEPGVIDEMLGDPASVRAALLSPSPIHFLACDR